MRLILFINGLLSDKIFIRIVITAIVIDAIAVLVGLFFLGLLLSQWNLDSKFEYLSSFLEIIIALDASCSFKKVQNWMKWKHDSYVENNIIPSGCMQITESMSVDVKPLYNAMQNIRRNIDYLTVKSGLLIAIIATILLVVGFTDSMKPYAVFAAAPILFFFTAGFVNNCFWTIANIRLGTDCEGVPIPVDDKHDVSKVVKSTGPV